jgi:hypothetical protein
MNNLLVFVFGLATAVLADIQDPPSNDYGPTRKLGRGLSNFFLAPAGYQEFPPELGYESKYPYVRDY